MGSESLRKYVRLADCTLDGKIPYGIVQPGKHVHGGIPIVRVNNINNGQLDRSNPLKVDPLVEGKYQRTRLKGGEVLLTLVGSTGQSLVAPPELAGWNVARAIAVIRPKEDVGAEWVNICLHSRETQHFLDVRANTTVQKTLNLKDIRDIPIFIPKTETKDFIESCWASLSRKIELNRRMNATLEFMAQALFKSWFIDFDPVIDKALAAGNPLPDSLHKRAEARHALGNQRKPLPASIAQHFPDRFVFNEEMGWVPEGWKVTALESITTELRRGISPKYLDDGGVRVVNQKCIRNHEVNFSLTRRHDGSKKKIDGRELAVGDVLVNSTGVGTLGRMAQVLTLDETTVADSHVTVVRPDDEAYKPYTFARMMLALEPAIEAMGEGSTGQTELSRANLQAVRVLVPSVDCQERIERILYVNAEKMAMNSMQIEVLARIRDTLLPELLSGELRIPDAEKRLEEAL